MLVSINVIIGFSISFLPPFFHNVRSMKSDPDGVSQYSTGAEGGESQIWVENHNEMNIT